MTEPEAVSSRATPTVPADADLFDEYRRALLRGRPADPTRWLRRHRPGRADCAEELGSLSLLMGARRAADRAGTPESPRALADGQILVTHQGHQLRVLGLLNSGGMGEVYVAHHEERDEEVAVKVPRHLERSEEFARRFLERELKAHEHLRAAPHIVHAVDCGRAGRSPPFLVMEYVWGENLHDHLRKHGPMAVERALLVGRQIGQALEAAHAARVIHRDLKPANVMLADDGSAKLLDWGLARLPERRPASRTAPQTILGTEHFLAPEQARAPSEVDGRADLYSLGCTLFFLLTGKPPFHDCPSQVALIQAHCSYPRPSLRRERPDVTPALEAVVRRLMDPSPEKRFASATEFLRALDALARPRRARRPSPVRRQAALLALLGALLAGLPTRTAPVSAGKAEAVAKDRKPPTPSEGGAAPVPAEEAVPGPRLGASLQIMRWSGPVGEGRRHHGEIGLRSPRGFVNDRVRVFVELNRPAYGYLIAFLPDGREQLCWPADETSAPARTRKFDFPKRKPESHGWVLDGANGAHAFVLVLSKEPLPAYAEWKRRNGSAPWARYRAPGYQEFDSTRGKRLRENNPFRDVCEFLRDRPDVDLVRGKAFPVLDRLAPAAPPQSSR